MIDTASVCTAFLKNDSKTRTALVDTLGVSEDKTIVLMEFLCAIHDIGKVNSKFQSLEDSMIRYRHDIGGYLVLTRHLMQRVEPLFTTSPPIDRKLKSNLRTLLRCAAMHHGSPKGWSNEEYEESFPLMFDEESLSASETVLEHIMKLLQLEEGVFAHILESEGFKEFSTLAAGVITLCDWIASGEFDYCSEPMPLELYRSRSIAHAS